MPSKTTITMTLPLLCTFSPLNCISIVYCVASRHHTVTFLRCVRVCGVGLRIHQRARGADLCSRALPRATRYNRVGLFLGSASRASLFDLTALAGGLIGLTASLSP